MRTIPRATAASLGAHAIAVLLAFFYARAHATVEDGTLPDSVEIALLWARPSAEPTSVPLEIVQRPSPPDTAPLAPRDSPQLGARVVMPHIAPLQPMPEPPPEEPSNPNNPLGPAPAFVSWSPGHEPHHAAANGLADANLVASADQDAENAAAHGGLAPGSGGPVDQPGGREQAIDASTGYVRRMLEDATNTQVPGSADYYRHVRVAAARAWRPMPVPEPTFLQGVLGTFIAPYDVSVDAARRSLGPFATGRAGAAAVDLDNAHPNSPMLAPRNTMAARADAAAHTTRVEVEVDQDASGQIVGMRVVRRSGVAGYDTAAMDAIRDAVHQAEQHAMPGGWRSRWEFAITVSRDPLISSLPGLPGDAPSFGLTAEVSFDEVTGETELHLPGRLHRRRLVRLMSSRVIAPPQPATTAARQ